MSKMRTTIQKEKGKILDRDRLRLFFDGLPDGKFTLEADDSAERTSPQNRYLHGVLLPEWRKALNYAGYNEVRNDEHAKLLLKSMFQVEHTSRLNTVDFNKLVNDAIQFAAEHMNHQIPYPNEKF